MEKKFLYTGCSGIVECMWVEDCKGGSQWMIRNVAKSRLDTVEGRVTSDAEFGTGRRGMKDETSASLRSLELYAMPVYLGHKPMFSDSPQL